MTERRRRSGLTRRLVVFAPAMIVVTAGILSFSALLYSVSMREWVTRTHEVLNASSALLTGLLEAETAQRGYLLTRDRGFLIPSSRTLAHADSMLARLRALTLDSPRQQARLDTLAARAHARLALLDSSIAVGSFSGAVLVGVDVNGAGRALMSDAQRLVRELEAEEEVLLRLREQDEAVATTSTSAVLIAGTLAAAMLAFIINRNFDRALRERREALLQTEAANEQLRDQAVELELQAEESQAAALEAESATEQAEQAMHAAEESERRAERLQRATEAFSGALSIDEVANLIVDEAIAAIAANSGELGVITASGDSLRVVAVRNGATVSVGGTMSMQDHMPLCEAARSGMPVLLSSADEIDARFPGAVPRRLRDDVQAIGAFPLVHNGKSVGTLLVRFNHPRAFSSAERGLMGALSRIAVESFERARLFDAEREARTAAEAANRAKAAFLASMSHELRTPLQAALGFAQLVRLGVYGSINDQQAEVLGRVERSQSHLTRLIDDILDFARIEAGHVRFNVEQLSIVDTFVELAPLVEPMAMEKGIALSITPPPQSLRAFADRQRLQQILVNLVGNAIKFTERNGTIGVDARANGDRVRIQVSDTGIGIPADRIEAIFEPFVQVDSGLTRAHEGVGLGLSISRDLARTMGGDVTVKSEVGKGSTFVVALPAVV
jgi:signal transduction histidine kinase/CHASE3 domain sensor protein